MKAFLIARREVSSYLDQPMAYVVVPGFLILSAAYLFVLNPFFIVDRATMRPFFEFTPVVFSFFIPAVAMRLLAEERKSGMLDLLLSWPLSIGHLVLGKFLGASLLISSALLLTLPYAISINAIGDLDWGPVLGGYAGLVLLALSNLAIGLFLSALTRNQIIAFISGFLVCFGFFICGRLSPYVSPATGQILTFLSFETHFSSIARGVIDFRDIAYFVGVISIFLALATEAIRFSRWPRPIRLSPSIRESAIFISLTVLLVSALNVAAQQGCPRLDLTSDARYTLPDSTKRLLAEAEVPITIKAYLPTHVQPPYSTVVTAMVDKLTEYVEAAPSGIHLTVIDPSDPNLDPASRKRIATEAQSFGIEQRELQVQQGDRVYRERIWFGVALLYKDRTQVVGAMSRTVDLDLSLTRALRDLIYGESKATTIGIATGHGEPDLINSPLATDLRNTGVLEPVTFQDKPIPADIDVLVILGPRKAYSEIDRYFLDQYLLRGGALVALLDYRTPSSMFPNVLVNVHTGLENLFSAYGLEIDTRYTVLDRIHNAPKPPTRVGDDPGLNSPLYPRINQLDPEHPITQGLSFITAPLSVPLNVAGSHWQPIATASDKATLRADVDRTDTGNYETPHPQELRNKNPAIAAVTRSVLQSAFSKSGPPEGLDIDADYPHLQAGHSDSRLFVATSGVRLLAAESDGFILLQNAIDWAAMQTDLVTIRNRRVQAPTLSADDPTVRLSIKTGNILGPTLFCLIIGFIRRRKNEST